MLLGSAEIDATGNNTANTLSGNDADNSLFGRGGDDTLHGNGGIDRLYGGDDNDVLYGGDGNDFVEGGAGQDRHFGGAGADFFVFREGDFAGSTPSTADRISDFSSAEGDRIRLNYLDANTSTGADDAFSFLGTGAFTGVAGQLRYEQIGSNTYVYGDTDGDAFADFMIRVDGLHTFSVGDFVL